MTSSKRHYFILALWLALGLAMRTYGAWIYEFAHTSDHGIICLMVKHMLEGNSFPVFFYGLPYMGSLEPALSAGLCYLFELNGFWINMGTALTAFAFLPLVYLWGRGAAGRTAGLAALAFCAIGPPQYFQFESWADGGYAAIPLLTCALLVFSLRLLTRDLEGAPPSHVKFALLGLIAGLGWWQSPLLIPAFLVCAFLFLVVMRGRLFTLRLLSGAGGFLIGSLPLWIWNLRNHWQTFDMVKTHNSPPLLEGLRLFYAVRLPTLLELHRQTDMSRILLVALLLALAALALFRLVSAWRKAKHSEGLYLGAAFLYLAVFSILFGRSRFALVDAMRYVLILIPILAVLIGAATAWLTDRIRWKWLGWLPVACLVLLQVAEMPKRPPERQRTEVFMPHVQMLGAFLRERNIRHLYTDYQVRRANHALNFLLAEEFVFSPVTRERYRPYARAMESAAQPAVLNNTMGFSNFLKMTAAACETNEVEGMLIQYKVEPPSDAWRLVRSELVAMETGTNKAEIVLRLSEPAVVCGIRLLCDPDTYPAAVGLEVSNQTAGGWAPVLAPLPVTRYFWSGSRFYWGGNAYRLDCRFAPVKTSAIRIRMKAGRSGGIGVREVRVMASDPGKKSPVAADVVGLADWIKSNGLKRVYADRWESNQLVPLTDSDVKLSLPPHLYDRETLPPEMALDEQTAIVVRSREQEALSRDPRIAPNTRTNAGPWTIFTFQTPRSSPVDTNLVWRGCGIGH